MNKQKPSWRLFLMPREPEFASLTPLRPPRDYHRLAAETAGEKALGDSQGSHRLHRGSRVYLKTPHNNKE